MIIVDTNVLIDIRRGRESVKLALKKFKGELPCISAITIQELNVGLGYTKIKMGNELFEKQKRNIYKIVNDFEIFAVTTEILEHAGLKEGILLANGKKIDTQDVIIGITAEKIGAKTLITRNPEHFSSFSVSIESYLI